MAWIIGGPGSGKSTQSQKIARQYGYVHIDPSTLKKEVEFKETNGKTLPEAMRKSGNQAPLHDILPMIEHKVYSGKNKGVVIDGYPGSLEEAGILERSIGRPDIVIALEVDEETSTRRSTAKQQSLRRPTLSEYVVASREVIQRYEDITAKVDSNQEPYRVFEVIKFNIDALYMAEERLSRARRSNSLGPQQNIA
ncbi:adenylate kinase isoenzyme 1-like [Drosophila serrata]|uniref:adenylate kinase isoenzyme 1-like n=1 Tax=Drosophila serrata TaxID=7274 RepID=UPI000A1D22A9|nr:adenylate kinase isoenzyme 1-like [Drosophila serrata]